MKIRIMAALFAMGVVTVAALPAMAQYGACRVELTMLNSTRHVVGEVNAECPPSWHSVPFGNWGVESNFGSRGDSTQFTGWKWEDNKFQWNSCTRDHIRDDNVSCNYYNHDHNGNGRCEDQGSNGEYGYGGLSVLLGVNCPKDTNYDGRCDTGGCREITTFTVTNQYLHLWELDNYDFDDYIGTLNVHSGCCTVSGITCNAYSCSGPRYSSMYPTSGYAPTSLNTTANVRMRFDRGTFVNYYNQCLTHCYDY